jgi:hypothetical protein
MPPALISRIQGIKMKIIGAGMAGLLAGQYFRSHQPIILEHQESLPNNHHALLRFRSNVVSDLTGIRFKKVKVHKMINYKGDHFTQSNLHLNNMYSHKVTGAIHPRSAIDLSPAERFIAPPDFIRQAAQGLDIEYCVDGTRMIDQQMLGCDTPLISTMPMRALASTLNFELDCELKTKSIWTVKFDLCMDIDIYQTVYYPNPDIPLYRLSVTGNKVIAEFTENPYNHWQTQTNGNIYHFLENDFAIPASKERAINHIIREQLHGKLIPADREILREFMAWATREYNIYSLGRWGTHRQLLMDDVVQDLKVIGNLIASGNYSR